MSHWVGVFVQTTSRPLVMVSPALPLANAHFQPRPCCSIGAASGSGPTRLGIAGAVGLADRVAADDQRGRLLVVHRHAAERLADVLGRGQWIRLAFGAFRVHVDQAHGGGA